MGLGFMWGPCSQGSGFAATLGWRTESRWDSWNPTQRTDRSRSMTQETLFEKFERFVDTRAVKGAVDGSVVAVNFSCPNRAMSLSPGLARRAYPGSTFQDRFNPTGVAAFGRRRTQPRWGWASYRGRVPRVAALPQPWAGGRNPFGIRGTGHNGLKGTDA